MGEPDLARVAVTRKGVHGWGADPPVRHATCTADRRRAMARPGPFVNIELAADAAEHLARQTPARWAHVDLDVLRGREFAACDAAIDPTMPGGLTWTELTAIVGRALQDPKCRGLSVGVYNTDLDRGRRAARRIVRFLAAVTGVDTTT